MAQIVVALLISLAALLYNALTRPFVDPALDKLQIFALATQVMSLTSQALRALRLPSPRYRALSWTRLSTSCSSSALPRRLRDSPGDAQG